MADHEVEKIFQDLEPLPLLPPYVWQGPIPAKDHPDYESYAEFVQAWYSDEEELHQHWADYDGTGAQLRALAYSCITEGSDSTHGRFNKYDIYETEDDGRWWSTLETGIGGFTNTAVEFGGTWIMVAGEPTDLPEADVQLSAQSEGYHSINAFLRFAYVPIPAGATINYARLKFTASDQCLNDCKALIAGGIPSDVSPENWYECNQWERTDNRKDWDVSEDWIWNNVYYSPNILDAFQVFYLALSQPRLGQHCAYCIFGAGTL